MAADWTAIENEYISSTKSYEALAKEYGCAINEVKRHGRDGKWVRKRSEFNAKRLEALQDSALKLKTEQGLNCIRKLQDIAEKAIDRCRELLDTCCTQKQASDLMDAINTAKNLVRDVYGLPTLLEQASMETARRKAELEEKKFGAANAAEDVRIVIEGGEEYDG